MVYCVFSRGRFLFIRKSKSFLRLLCDSSKCTNVIARNPAETSSNSKESVQSDLSDDKKNATTTSTSVASTKEIPEEPTTCCMSGCPTCVWLEYAEKLNAYFQDGGETAIKELNERISDQNIKAFILHEWRMRQKSS